MKRILSLILALSLLLGNQAWADGDPNIDGGAASVSA